MDWPLSGSLDANYIPGMAQDEPQPLIIGAEEHESYFILPGRAEAGLIVLCDHAGNAIPPGYGTLGLSEAQLQRHIAYDIGAAAITRIVSDRLGVPALMTRYSRLLIDPNRGSDDPTLIMRLSDGAVIPGNCHLDDAERAKRIRLYYAPYHRAIDAVLDRCLASGVAPCILSIHSFTESWKTLPRPWHVGVLWDRDDRLAKPLLERFWAEGDLIVGANEPYSGRLEGDCLWQHASKRGLVHALIEVRQDLIRDPSGQRAWAKRICRIMQTVLGEKLPLGRGPRTARVGDFEGVARAGEAFQHRACNNGDAAMMNEDKASTIACEAAAFRRLLQHLRERTDVQNIDLMNLAGFCRNCLANWYQEAATAAGLKLSKDGARELIYGMPYKEWQAKYQKEASAEQTAAYVKAKPHSH